MATRIRLQRHGKKDKAFFHIVVADGRAPRDGAFIEKLGVYNPNTNPATIDINFDSALTWLKNGAVPSDTCAAILSYKGLNLKKHLDGGVQKGALTQEQADAKFAAWLQEKDSKIENKKAGLAKASTDWYSKKMETEKASKEAKSAKNAAKNAEAAATVETEAAAENTDAPAENTENNA